LRTHRDLPALIIIFGTWTTIPLLILTDRLSFDGATLRRNGLVAFVQKILFRRVLDVSIDDVERVEVSSVRTVRRGGNVRYRYRVDVLAEGACLTFSSGQNFRRMVRALLPRIGEHKLDARACELRDHLVETAAVREEADRLGIASSDVLENTNTTVKRIEQRRRDIAMTTSEQDLERAALLRRCANDLRMAGTSETVCGGLSPRFADRTAQRLADL
jgi:hypothetical protein